MWLPTCLAKKNNYYFMPNLPRFIPLCRSWSKKGKYYIIHSIIPHGVDKWWSPAEEASAAWNSFWQNFNLWRTLLVIDFFIYIKTPIDFLYKWGLNLRSLIQLSNSLSVELTGTNITFVIDLQHVVWLGNWKL